MPDIQKKATTPAARALKIKAQKTQIQTNIETFHLNRLEQKLIERVTEKVIQNVKQRLTATVATQTESPRAAPTTTVAVQVKLVKKVTIATQTEEPENEWVLEQYTEQPMNELDNSHEMLMRICSLSNGYRVENPPRDQAQATEPR